MRAPRPRLGISACLLGEPVRHNGGHTRDDIVAQLARDADVSLFCPEMAAGFGTPRPSMRLEGDAAAPRVVARTGEDVTERLANAARALADQAVSLALDGVILKKGSPSCGLLQVRVYPGPGAAPRRDGRGLFAAALAERAPFVALEEEGRLHDPTLRDHFAERIHASARWRGFVAGEPGRRALMEFHAAHKMQVLSHDPAGARALGRLAAAGATDEYGPAFARAIARPATRGTHANALLHLLGHTEGGANAELAGCIEEYRAGHVPLVVPTRLLLHHLRLSGTEWALSQRYFDPYPAAMRLRGQV